MRVSKVDYYLEIALSVAKRSTCLRRRFGCIIVNNDEIIATGYNGAPRGRKNCSELGFCMREKLNIPRGERYEMCRSVHAEQNAIISASRKDCIGATLYLMGIETDDSLVYKTAPCMLCKRMVINSGITKVITKDLEGFIEYSVEDWINDDDSLKGEFGY